MGHTMSIHSQNDQVILEFGLKKPAFRICVNTPTTHGSIGLTTGLDPAMTLGCGGYGGNITSDNISPRHLLNIKRLAYELSPAVRSGTSASAAAATAAKLPKPAGISAAALSRRIDEFLGTRGYRGQDAPAPAAARDDVVPEPRPEPGSVATADVRPADPAPLDFVCEEDVRTAIRAGKKLVVSERAIVTPSARELAEEHRVLTVAPWRT
jgi:acetaldehyde dehydrogenase (acetylating)